LPTRHFEKLVLPPFRFAVLALEHDHTHILGIRGPLKLKPRRVHAALQSYDDVNGCASAPVQATRKAQHASTQTRELRVCIVLPLLEILVILSMVRLANGILVSRQS
jgi:hypothetical protein